MLSIEQAVLMQRTYRANEKYRDPLGDTTLVAAVGATAVGKNFLMEKSGLPVVGTLTTREPRATDDPERYRYVDLDAVLEKIERGEIIQYGAYPPNIYASELQDYVLDQPNVSDIYYSAVSDLNGKGFKDLKSFSTLVPKEQWMSQLMERFDGMPVGAIHARLAEARNSLRWTRAQHLGARATDHLVVINTVHSVDENITKIIDFANGKRVDPPDDDTVRQYIEEMEEVIAIVTGRLG
jgi:guanylate kinase